MRITPYPPPLPTRDQRTLRQVEWIMIFLLTGRQRRLLPDVGESHVVFRRVINGRYGDLGLPHRVHKRAKKMLASLPPAVREHVSGSVENWNDLRQVGQFLDCHEPTEAEQIALNMMPQLELVAHALIYLCDKGESVPLGDTSCKYCWRPTIQNSKFCDRHVPNTLEYWIRRRAYSRERKLLPIYVRDIRKKRRIIARQTDTLDGEEIEGDLLVELPRYWPTLAKYIGFSQEEDALIGDILVKLEYGPTPNQAIENMQKIGVPFYWSNLDCVEAYLSLWDYTASRRCEAGKQAKGLHRLSDADQDYAIELGQAGLTQR